MQAKPVEAGRKGLGRAWKVALVLAVGGALSGAALQVIAQTDCCKAHESKAEAKKEAPAKLERASMTHEGKAAGRAKADVRAEKKDGAKPHGPDIDCCKKPPQ